MQTFNIMISLVESLVLLIKIHRDYYKNIPLLPWKYGTESCEHIFGISCQFCANFNYLEIVQMVPKINQYLRSVKSDDLMMFRKEKKLPTLWLEDFWDDNSKFRYTDNNEKINNDNLNISQSINCAVSKLSNQENQEELNSSDLDVSSLLKKNYGTCQVIVEHIQKLPDILWYPNYSKDFDYPLNNRLLNIEHFLNLRQHHDAYLNRKLECKNILLKNYNNETDGEFDINK
ncbi:hypothetical protein GLOIN_2v1885938 [Rhizophagus irregularis DAOM 181602=DAOM 197198]|nr:hypothetical protein GLOIN_2v1885938 [Rhizophagus irregularis DAOM 181602=DAOM 197198]